MLAFSFTVPLTRVAVQDGHMSPLFVGAGRAVIAAILAAVALRLTNQPRPRGRQWVQVAIVAGGVVVGFPLLTSFALTSVPANHGAVVIALLPAVTAVTAVLRTGELAGRLFWAAGAVGAVAAIAFAAAHSGGPTGLTWPDLLLLAAVGVCAIGYAEGGVLSRELGSWQTISWALLLAWPVMLVLTVLAMRHQPPTGGSAEWAAFGYLAVFSAFVGFIAWYRGLAIGPMAQVSQVQLVQPVLTLCWSALLLGEHLAWQVVTGGLVVIMCALIAVRSRPNASLRPHGRSEDSCGVGEA